MNVSVSSPELQQVDVTFYPIDNDTGKPSGQPVAVREWTSYTFENDFTTPTDSFHFTLGIDRPEDLSFRLRALRPGAKCELRIGGLVQATGYIDAVEYSTTRDGGIQVDFIGRDAMGRVVDANSDPTLAFKEGQTVEDFLATLLTPFGFGSFNISNDDNRALQTGMGVGLRYAKSKRKFGTPLKKRKLHQLKPYNGEGLFQFVARVSQRQGLWLRASADGESVVAAKPTFDGDPTFRLRRSFSATDNNMLECRVRADIGNQPTIIFADGFSGGGEFGRGRTKAIAINPAVLTYDPKQDELIAKYRDAVLVELRPHANPLIVTKCKPLFLHDDESKTQEQLEHFVRRELAHHRKKSLVVTVTVEGHGQFIDGRFVPWVVDTLVDFADEISGIIETLWILGRSFHRDRSGTKTTLYLVRPYSLEF